jgi:ferric-dicitrate binding protein FerR (iron transport regulator)
VCTCWLLLSPERNQKTLSEESAPHSRSTDILPGINKAILTIGDNKPIDLASNKTGITINKVITYNDGEKIADAGQLLELSTPKGGQYQLLLPDGSKIWLNAASSIKFPSMFKGDKREVAISGEAYLEIAKNTRQPFIVTTGKTSIQVLGTSFNINAYPDENAIKTTLITGSIKVVSGTKEVLLKPGEQSEITGSDQCLTHSADIADVLAWKNGMFHFNKTTIEPIMRQLSRWYNLEVIYKGEVKDRFISTIPRDVPLLQVLEALELTNAVKFEVAGNRITVIGY